MAKKKRPKDLSELEKIWVGSAMLEVEKREQAVVGHAEECTAIDGDCRVMEKKIKKAMEAREELSLRLTLKGLPDITEEWAVLSTQEP